jgi:23S rRNA-intervening sequence protein
MTKTRGDKRVNDLQERTACFGEAVISFVRRVPINAITSSVINQLVRASTSVGANYCEADDAESKKDFRHKISICLKGGEGNASLVKNDCGRRTRFS